MLLLLLAFYYWLLSPILTVSILILLPNFRINQNSYYQIIVLLLKKFSIWSNIHGGETISYFFLSSLWSLWFCLYILIEQVVQSIVCNTPAVFSAISVIYIWCAWIIGENLGYILTCGTVLSSECNFKDWQWDKSVTTVWYIIMMEYFFNKIKKLIEINKWEQE